MNDKWMVLVIGLATVWLSGCSVFYTPGMSELEELCEKDGGITIRKDLRVDGYFKSTTQDCYGCWNDIIVSGYDYIEFKNKRPRPYRYFGGVPGYHRVFKAPKDSPQCNAAIWKWNLSKKVGSEQYDRFFEDYCIASTPIDQPTAQYGYFEETNEWRVNEWYGSTIGRYYAEVRDLNSAEVVGEKTNYLLNPWPKSALSYGEVFDCTDIGRYNSPRGYGRDLRSAVFKSK